MGNGIKKMLKDVAKGKSFEFMKHVEESLNDKKAAFYDLEKTKVGDALFQATKKKLTEGKGGYPDLAESMESPGHLAAVGDAVSNTVIKKKAAADAQDQSQEQDDTILNTMLDRMTAEAAEVCEDCGGEIVDSPDNKKCADCA